MKRTAKTKTSASLRPDVFAYHDHRIFLRDLARHLAVTERLSLRALARRAGLSSAYLPLVLQGKRKLSSRSLELLLPQLGLDDDERRQLVLLVRIGEAASSRRRHDAVEALQLDPRYRQTNPTEADVFEYLSRWHYVVVREMANLPDFRLDARWIQARLPDSVTLPEVRRAMRFLVEKGFLHTTSEGQCRVGDRNLDCTGSVFRAALRRFHRGIAEATWQSLDETPRDAHHVMGHTMAFPQAAFPRVQAILEEAIGKVRALEAECASTADSVYHVNVLATPVASLPTAKGRKTS